MIALICFHFQTMLDAFHEPHAIQAIRKPISAAFIKRVPKSALLEMDQNKRHFPNRNLHRRTRGVCMGKPRYSSDV